MNVDKSTYHDQLLGTRQPRIVKPSHFPELSNILTRLPPPYFILFLTLSNFLLTLVVDAILLQPLHSCRGCDSRGLRFNNFEQSSIPLSTNLTLRRSLIRSARNQAAFRLGSTFRAINSKTQRINLLQIDQSSFTHIASSPVTVGNGELRGFSSR